MYKGTQSELVKELGCSRTAISKLVKVKDYRIIYIKKSKRINIEASLKALIDSGFGKRSNPIQKKGKKSAAKNVKKSEEKPAEEIDTGQPLLMESGRSIIERRKAFHQAEKFRIDNDERLGKLIDVDEVGERSFDLWRQVRDAIQAIKDRCTIKIRSAETDHEGEQILQDEIHNILTNIVDGYENLDDSALKKKLVLSLTR